MKKHYIFYLIFLLSGVIIGAILNSNWKETTIPLLSKTSKEPTKIITITDTVYIQKESKPRKMKVAKVVSDSVPVFIDTFYTAEAVMDTVEVEIVRERIVATKTLSIALMEKDSVPDSEVFNNEANAFSQSISIEFWESPLNLTGYQLTKTRLKLFGFNPSEEIVLTEGKNSTLIVGMGSGEVTLQKSEKFKSL